MEYTASHIAKLIGGKVVGDSKVKVHKLSRIEDGESGSMSFLSNSKYNNYLYETDASVVIVNDDFVPDRDYKATLIKVENAYSAFTSLLGIFNGKERKPEGIHPSAQISPDAVLANNITVGAYTVVGKGVSIGDGTFIHPNVNIGAHCKIGKNCLIFPGTVIYDDCIIGDDVIIHARAVIGSDGFGFAPQDDGSYKKIPQTGNVIIENKVEIGAGTIIDRATMGSTRIGEGVKLDNLIQVAHNVEIGAHTVIAAQSGIAGSAKIGKYCVIGGQTGIAGHLKIGDRVKIQAQSGISKNLKDDAVVQGTPAFSYNDWNRSYVYFKRLPAIIKKIEQLLKTKL